MSPQADWSGCWHLKLPTALNSRLSKCASTSDVLLPRSWPHCNSFFVRFFFPIREFPYRNLLCFTASMMSRLALRLQN